MASNSALTQQQSSLHVEVQSLSEDGSTAAAINVQLLPRLGQSQIIRITSLVTPPTDDAITIQHDIILFDQAFEDVDLYGRRKEQKGG